MAILSSILKKIERQYQDEHILLVFDGDNMNEASLFIIAC